MTLILKYFLYIRYSSTVLILNSFFYIDTTSILHLYRQVNSVSVTGVVFVNVACFMTFLSHIVHSDCAKPFRLRRMTTNDVEVK